MQCPKCKENIKIGTAGQDNLDSHMDSARCKKNQRALKKKEVDEKSGKKQVTLGGFFKKVVRAMSPSVAPPPRVHPVQVRMADSDDESDSAARASPAPS
jgi:hypothetical protein